MAVSSSVSVTASTITTSWTGTYTATNTSGVVITGTDYSCLLLSSTFVRSSSATYTETDTETVTCTDYSCQPTSSASVPTDTPTDTDTVSCSDENCQLPPATSFTSTTIETSYVSGSSNSLSPVSSVAPSVETSSVIMSTPALITTANENKAASLKLGGLFILLLQFI
ncbi:hypothetical protein D499_0AQ00250 [Hanseniaspora uvarum DSM 2768]|nr:hypothetical protein D499_0AQ00250 [Hanseniaspora uvarum DSM 2768]